MKTLKHFLSEFLQTILFAMFLFGFNLQSDAQTITVYQYRQVEPDKMQEFIERETKYWSKVAESAIAKGNLTFWGLFQKMSGFDQPNSSNVLFINTFKDIDAAADIWDPSELFPDVPMDQIETFSMSKVIHTLYVRAENFVQKEGAVPADEFNYVSFIYHNSSNSAQSIALEKEHWEPFIKLSMDAGKTNQLAWGNATILAPSGPDIGVNTISFDIYPSLKAALDPTWDDDTVFPTDGLTKINELEIDRRMVYVYRRIQVINANPPE